MWETIREYLTFTKKERIGVLFLLLIISLLFILPYFLRPALDSPDPLAYLKMSDSVRNYFFAKPDTVSDFHEPYFTNQNPKLGFRKIALRKTELFFFDPNLLDYHGWQRLGITDRQAQTICRYVQKGGFFRKAEDLQKIYGIQKTDYDRLFPYIRISKPIGESSYPKREQHENVNHNNFDKRPMPAEINEADSAVWCSLPGIGPRLAVRIINFREKLGGFYRIDQVAETYGLSDSSYQRIKSFLLINPVHIRRMNLNKSTVGELQKHPYIRWKLARQIVEYRRQHGNFQSVNQLLQLEPVDSLNLEKLKPYLEAGD